MPKGARQRVSSFLLLGVTALFAMGEAADLESLKNSSAYFARDLFSVLRKEHKDKNLILSPISLQIALAVVNLGAKTTTKDEISKALHIDANDENALTPFKDLLAALKDPALAIATTYFVDKSIKLLPTYETSVTEIFGGSTQTVDFNQAAVAAAAINEWCEQNTNNKINKIFEASDLEGALSVLANAVHFKANWKKKFDAHRTRDEDFKAPSGLVKVKMMHITSTYNYADVPEIEAQVLEMPYEGDKFRMLIVLPHEDTTLAAVEDKLDSIPIQEIINKLSSQEVEVSLPKFKIEQEIDLERTLKKLGVTSVFSNSADLSGISQAALKVSKVKQKVFIQVDEAGTEAAAVTGTGFERSLVRNQDQLVFKANRPFIAVTFIAHMPLFTAILRRLKGKPVGNMDKEERTRQTHTSKGNTFNLGILLVVLQCFLYHRNYLNI